MNAQYLFLYDHTGTSSLIDKLDQPACVRLPKLGGPTR